MERQVGGIRLSQYVHRYEVDGALPVSCPGTGLGAKHKAVAGSLHSIGLVHLVAVDLLFVITKRSLPRRYGFTSLRAARSIVGTPKLEPAE